MNFESLWQQIVYNVVFYGIQPFLAFIQNESFFYWPYVLAFFLLALAVRLWRREYVQGAFSRRVWWSRSARADYVFYLVNGMLYPALLGGVLLSVPVVGGMVAAMAEGLVGRSSMTAEPAMMVVSYTLLYFLFYDFGRFLAHWIQHKWDVLWQFHALHHSAEVLTPVTSFRVHPVDLVVMSLGETLFAGLLYGVFAWLFPGQFEFVVFLGAHVLLVAYRLLGNLRHSHVWLSYGPLERLLISPAMHQIHHSYLPEHRDKNMGFAFSIWDQLFGTAYIPRRRETFPMGLGDGQDDGSWHSLGNMYLAPFKGLWRLLLARAKRQSSPT